MTLQQFIDAYRVPTSGTIMCHCGTYLTKYSELKDHWNAGHFPEKRKPFNHMGHTT